MQEGKGLNLNKTGTQMRKEKLRKYTSSASSFLLGAHITQLTVDHFSETGKKAIKATNFTLMQPKGASLHNIQVCGIDSNDFFSPPRFWTAWLGMFFRASEMLNSWQMRALPKHPKVIPTQLGQPALQTARKPEIENANGKKVF